jgi:antitoxin component of MazEF toxin-antitoxin module
MRRKMENRNIRKVFKRSGSYALTLPIELIRELKIKEGQKLVVKKIGQRIVVEDWKK